MIAFQGLGKITLDVIQNFHKNDKRNRESLKNLLDLENLINVLGNWTNLEKGIEILIVTVKIIIEVS